MPDAELRNVLYRWPAAAAFGRTVPKRKFYEHGNVRATLREKFVDDVQRITWAYKLAETTIRLQSTSAVPEIQVFAIETKGSDVGEDVLVAVDRSVYFPVIFEITNGERVRTAAAHKTLGGATPKVGAYFSTGWLSPDAARQPLPVAVDLQSLYEAILSRLLPVQTHAGESVSDATARLNDSAKLQREVAALARKLRAEPQLNRKIELRRRLREHEAALARLNDPASRRRG